MITFEWSATKREAFWKVIYITKCVLTVLNLKSHLKFVSTVDCLDVHIGGIIEQEKYQFTFHGTIEEEMLEVDRT